MSTKKKLRIIVIGGNRLNEIYPFDSIIKLKKKYNFDLEVFTEKTHLLKNVNSKKFKFKDYLKLKKIKFNKVNSYLELKKKINDINLNSQCYILLLNSLFKIKEDIIKIINGQIYNLHVGKLPEQRGAGTTTWQFMSNLKSSAVTIHRVSTSFDTGHIVIEKKFNCSKLGLPLHYYKKVSKIEHSALDNFFYKIISNRKFNEKKQNENKSVYMPRLDTQIHSYINWSWSKKDIILFIKSFDKPFLGSRSFVDKRKCIITDASSVNSNINFHPFQSGLIIREYKGYKFIAVKGGLIKAKIKLASKKNLSLIGKRIFTPQKYLEKALISRVMHKPNKIKLI